MTSAVTDAAKESRLRRAAKRLGLALCKSRIRNAHLDNQGGYQIINACQNMVVWGEKFDMTLEDVEGALQQEAKARPAQK